MAGTPQIAVQITGKSDLQKIFGQTSSQLKAFQAQNEKVSAQIRSMTSIGKSGFAAVDKSVTSLVRNTFDLYRNVSRVLDPLRAIVGGATLAGLGAVEAKFAALGATALQSGRALNMSVARQQIWGGAAVLANYSAQTAIAGISATEISSTEARLGQNGDAAKRWSIVFGGSSAWMKANDDQLMMRESKYLASLKGQSKAAAEAHLQSDLGQSADYVGFLSQGPATVQKQLNQSAADGAMSRHQAEVLAALNYQINNVGLSLKGLSISIATAVGPDITKALGGLTDWLNKNRGSITTDFQKMFGDIEKHVRPAIDDINKVVQAIGGWRPVLEGTIGVLTASAVVGIAAPFVRLGAAIAGLSGGGAGSFGALGAAMRSIGFGFVGGEIVKLGVTDATGSSDAGSIAGDTATGAIWGGDIAGRYGAILGGAAGLVYGLATDPAAHPASGKLPKDIADEIKADAMKYGIPEGFALAQFRAEGGGYTNVSKAGAFGPAQLMSGTAKMLGVATSVTDPAYDWRKNVDAGIRYDKQLMDQFNKQNSLVALAYNWGPGNAESWLHGGHSMDKVPDETKAYLAQIRANGGLGESGLQPDGNIGFGFTPSGHGTNLPSHPIGMDSEDRRAVTITVVPPANHRVIAKSTGGPIQVKTSRIMPWSGNSGWN